MRVDFEEGELEDLREAMQAYLKGMMVELARTDQRPYRAMLHEKVDRFERLSNRLERAATPAERALRRERSS
jgi:hypothetical protein